MSTSPAPSGPDTGRHPLSRLLLLLWCRMMLVMYSQRPNELMVKRVAMLGCSALVLAHAVKQDRQLGNTYAGGGIRVQGARIQC